MSKKVLLSFCLVFVSLGVFADSITDIVEKAQQQSQTAQSSKITYEQSKLSVSKALAKNDVQYSVSTGDMVVDTKDTSTSFLSAEPSLTVNYNDDNDSSVKLAFPVTYDTTSSAKVGLDTSYSTTFDYSLSDSTNELAAQKNLNDAQSTYESNLLQIEQQVINLVKNIVTIEKNIYEKNYELKSAQDSYDASLKTGEFTKESLFSQNGLLNIDNLKNSIKNYETSLALAKQQFKDYTGFEYTDIEDIDDVDLTVPTSSATSAIESAVYAKQIAQMNLDLAKQEENSLSLSSGISSTALNSNISLNTNLTYNLNNVSLKGGLDLGYEYGKSITPKVTLAGTYTSNATSNQDSLDIQEKENTLLQAQITEQKLKTEHANNILSLQSDVQSLNFEYQELLNTIEYDNSNLDQQNKLFDLGLINQSDLEDAKNKVEVNKYDLLLAKLNRLAKATLIKMEFI